MFINFFKKVGNKPPLELFREYFFLLENRGESHLSAKSPLMLWVSVGAEPLARTHSFPAVSILMAAMVLLHFSILE